MLKIISIMSAICLSGCTVMGVGQSEFKCGDGATKCDSVMTTYEKTNSPVVKQKTVTKPNDLVASVPALGAAIDAQQWPKPILEPAQVIRVWIAPFTDNKDALHWPSYVFAEVKTRKWSYGQPDFRSIKQLVPLQIDKRQTAMPKEGETR